MAFGRGTTCPSVSQNLEGAARATDERNVASYYHNSYNWRILRPQVVRLYICMVGGVSCVSGKNKLLPSGRVHNWFLWYSTQRPYTFLYTTYSRADFHIYISSLPGTFSGKYITYCRLDFGERCKRRERKKNVFLQKCVQRELPRFVVKAHDISCRASCRLSFFITLFSPAREVDDQSE